MTSHAKLEKEVNCCYFTLAQFALSRLSISPTAHAFLEDLLGLHKINNLSLQSIYGMLYIMQIGRRTLCQHVRTLNLALKGTCNVHMERYKCFTEAMTDVLLNCYCTSLQRHERNYSLNSLHVTTTKQNCWSENARCIKNNLSEKYLK